MGRFLNPQISTAISPLWVRLSTKSNPDFTTVSGIDAERVSVPRPIPMQTPVQVIGLMALSMYVISAWATDFSLRFLGTKPYLSAITGVAVFLCYLVSGKALEALRTTTGKLWAGLGVWMLLCVVFSRWRGGSFAVLQGYIPKQHMVALYMAAFVVTVNNCRTLLRACTVAAFVMLLSCVFMGGYDVSGRFVIPGNLWLNNPNDLAMQIVLSLGFFLFWLRQPSRLGRFAGIIGILGTLYYLPKTGSRGGMISALIFAGVWIYFSKQRLPLMVLSVCLGAGLLLLTSHNTLQRLTTLTANEKTASTGEEQKAVESQSERQHLLKAAIMYTLKNPLFGLGPGEFADALWQDGKKQGKHEASLGPHNTYAQVGAECGIPGLAMFVMAIVATIRSSYRLYRATEGRLEHQLLNAMAFSIFMLAVGFGVDLSFHHVTYSGNHVMILGLWISLENAAKAAGVQFRPV